MPLFDFECIGCQHFFEKEHPRGVENPPCPLCKGRTEKRISPPPVIFKGGGFYKTDSGAKAQKIASRSEQSEPKAVDSPKDHVVESTKKEPADTKKEDKTAPPETHPKH